MVDERRLPPHTVVYEAPNGITRESRDCWSWEEFHDVCDDYIARGWRRVAWIDRTANRTILEVQCAQIDAECTCT